MMAKHGILFQKWKEIEIRNKKTWDIKETTQEIQEVMKDSKPVWRMVRIKILL